MRRYAIRTEAKGDVLYVRTEIGLDMKLRVSLVAALEPGDTFETADRAERWVRKVARRDPSLPLTVVPV